MKYIFRALFISLLLVWVFTAAECNKPILPVDTVPIYSYQEAIVNPPDTFKIYFNLKTYGDKIARVTFKDSAVWLIERLGDGRANTRILSDTSYMSILESDTLGLQGNKEYSILTNNNNYLDIGDFFIKLTKLPIDYHTFSPKFK